MDAIQRAISTLRVRLIEEPGYEIQQAFSWNGQCFLVAENPETEETKRFVVSEDGFEDVTEQYRVRLTVEETEVVEV